jgi:multiple sugar transport system ATP-binding protein
MEIATGCLIHLEADPEGWRLFDVDGNAIALQQPQQALETIEPQLPPLT